MRLKLSGAPTGVVLQALYVGIHAFVNFVVTTGHLTGRVSSTDEHCQRVASAFAMVFYATAMGALYSSGARENIVPCPEGHVVYAGQEVCPVCGQSPRSGKEAATRHGA